MNGLKKKFIDECGGLVEEEVDSVKIIWTANPGKVFVRYLKKLRDTAWNGRIPSRLKVVLSGDKGSETTKFGLFVPTNIPNTQSPYNFLLLSVYQGPETQVLIKKATAVLFGFANSIIKNGGLEIDVGNGPEFVEVEVMFVSDLKMLPLVFGVSHSSSKTFCPLCLVKRDEHRETACSGSLRSLNELALLNIPLSNIVCPPLHLIQGFTNKILQAMDSEKREELLKLAQVRPSYRMSSLLTGREGQKFLKFVVDNPEREINYRITLTNLHMLSQWASIEKYEILAKDKELVPSRLTSVINAFSQSWRNDQLPAINKLHLLEAHLAEFIIKHSGWGIYGEQSIEALHHLGNIAEKCCFGANQNKGLKFLMKTHLVLATSGTTILNLPVDENKQIDSDSSDDENYEFVVNFEGEEIVV